MFRRLLSYKNISHRFYHTEHKTWETYNRQMNTIYKTNFTQDEMLLKKIDNALADSVVQHTKDIKNIKQDILHILSRLNELTKLVK